MSAAIARADYYKTNSAISDEQRLLAAETAPPYIEPPIMEAIAVGIYRLVGHEILWFPRLLASIFWTLGGVFIYLIARWLYSSNSASALFAVTIYLFIPYAIAVGRIFMPEPLMILALLISVYALLRYHKQPSRQNLRWAMLASAFAIFVKINNVFLVETVFLALAAQRHGLRKALTNRQTLVFLALSVLPAGLYYGYGLFVARFLQGQTGGRFILGYWFTLDYWRGWLTQIIAVLGLVLPIFVVQGVITLRRGTPRTVLLGLWLGYAAFGFVFNYHISTHDYYNVYLIPLGALTVANVAEYLFFRYTTRQTAFRVGIAFTIVVLVINVAFSIFTQATDLNQRAADAQAIGKLVGHTASVMSLTDEYGVVLSYYGEFRVTYWLSEGDLRLAALSGKPASDLETRLKDLSRYDYFVITSFTELARQPELDRYLTTHYARLATTTTYVVFDLRQRLD